ncbi:VOC family protein [cf. Phormidesmis sp. LEGE 11477]|uniref:VOC family protein n=1 Tax=cf. Phormidesmis sp. LEGE 11477 TaxID=1828680 RepID=UPI0018808CE3|nr:VOC family protein [cf. Phormidesmis sp. LEGE 11477]MBE9059579.1 hypothetical protein [cf. Phormidesmis sp. LEGE 11477]
MSDRTERLEAIEIKAFVPAQDYELSKAFYCELGFVMASDESGIAFFHCSGQSFLLQDFYKEAHAHSYINRKLACWLIQL